MKRRILHLFSGGLDSILSYKILERAGHDVTAICFETPFFPSAKSVEYGDKNKIKVRVLNIFKEYVYMLARPKYGYGKNLNPCIDCKAMMINKACRIAIDEGYDFVSTGEVLGQRPMSQTKGGFIKQKKLLEHPEMVIRVLSREDGENNLEGMKRIEIVGRERAAQMKMSEEIGITEYQTPSGGCFLTYKEFSLKAKVLLKKNLTEERYFYMIKEGRFKEYSCGVAVIGRCEEDNEKLLSRRNGEVCYQVIDGKGPVGIVLGKLNDEEENDLKETLLKYSKRDINEKDSIHPV
ncbi:MAG: hypothetical protein AB7T10_00835 [bacterium]